MEEPLVIKLESARGELLNALQVIQSRYNFPASILDGILSQILSDIRAEEKIELINASKKIIKENFNKEEK
ncbi:MAG: hypothetical protein HFJ40_05800 [Clostridia bacterium]|nr:hypothetical protein [Clostridia bacterium]